MRGEEGEVDVPSRRGRNQPADGTGEGTNSETAAATKKKSRKFRSSDRSRKKSSDRGKNEVEWDPRNDRSGAAGGSAGGGKWAADDEGKPSPSTWDPKQFDQQTGELGTWKDSAEPSRVQDLPSPALAEAPPEQRKVNPDNEEWPFKSPCAFNEKKKRKTPKSAQSASSDIDSVESDPDVSATRTKTKRSSDDTDDNADDDEEEEENGDDDINDDEDGDPTGNGSSAQSWKARESRKNNSHNKGSDNSDPARDSNVRKGKNRDSEPAAPRRTRSSRPDPEAGASDNPPSRPRPRSGSIDNDEDIQHQETVQKLADEPERAQKPKRRGMRRESSGSVDRHTDDEEDLGKGSFHRLAKDFDKPSSKSGSRHRRVRTPGSGSGRRRRLRDRGMDHSGHDDDNSEVYEEFGGDEEHEVKLKGDDSGGGGAGGGDGGEKADHRRMSWRERRAQNRRSRERSVGEDSTEGDSAGIPKGSGHGSRRGSGRRSAMRRSSSERWMRAVEQSDSQGADHSEVIQNRARTSLMNANKELSRSAHSMRRYNSGGVGAMSKGLEHRSYHGPDNRRTPRKPGRGSDAVESAESFDDEYESYELNLSGRSQRTLDSIEDLEDFEHIDFQTPGMIDYDDEIIELMRRANPENTAQLNRRVQRKRGAVDYDQDMPMMTRQALLTRQASSQVMRQRVDGSNIDRQRLMIRNDSMSSMASMASNEELSHSNHRQLRGTPGRRAPPRTKSSGMAAMKRNDVPGFMQTDPDDRRRLFRTRSTTTNSFRQYYNKPNKVAQLSRRTPEQREHPARTSSHVGLPHGSGGSGERKRPPQRAKSTTALRRPGVSPHRGGSFTPNKPARRVPRSESKPKSPAKDDVPDLKSTSSDSEDEHGVKIKHKKKPAKETGGSGSEMTPPKRKSSKSSIPKSPQPKHKTVNKRDMMVKRNRRKLHSVIYDAKMGVDMKDLVKKVQKGEIPKSPIKSLMMPSP